MPAVDPGDDGGDRPGGAAPCRGDQPALFAVTENQRRPFVSQTPTEKDFLRQRPLELGQGQLEPKRPKRAFAEHPDGPRLTIEGNAARL